MTPKQKLEAIQRIVDDANATDEDEGVDVTYLLMDLELVLKGKKSDVYGKQSNKKRKS